ncbi:hypothetical protein AVEN_131385-1 [Araneus ventricosus]|uniref:Speckle-type POZ protein n=1 Tax=Araneus ventricosus TaxID=182803 RepID=A0A4Y2U589_ARAVE|nr:hypothetical protein AVEN_131385-1 [Araneus ventricosus]
MEEEYKRKCFFYKWRIENFNFCWQKTGEHLESPLFFIEPSPETSWRLWLYPRGEDDGEYISCYLFRAEGGPEVIDVDFELSVSVGEQVVKPPVSFEKIYSFKNCQKEGEKSFALRREIFLRKPFWEERFTLTIGCRIFKRNGDGFKVTENFGRTTIAMERISGMDVFDDVTDLNPESDKDIEVKTQLEADPFISINLSHFDDSLTIKIHPKSCEKIKYAICKITIIKSWEKASPIEHVRSWVGEIKTDIWRYDVPLPLTKSAEQDFVTNAQKTFFLHYDFAYSTGVEYANNELNDYGTDLWLENISFLESSCKYVKTEESTDYLTAMDALKPSDTSKSFADMTITTKTTVFKVHKAVLRARSSELAEMLKDNPENIELGDYRDGTVKRFLLFLYTDSVEDLYWQAAMDLYAMADKFKVEFLKKKCRSFLEINCDAKNVAQTLLLAIRFKDRPLKAHLMKYIVAHDEEVFSTNEWQSFAENYWFLAEECMLMKYREKIPNF